MKAWIQCEFGSPDVLRLTNIEKPVPTDSQVLVRVLAAAINPADWHAMRGTPVIARFAMGWRKPADIRFGGDFAGIVEAVGKAVTRFAPGDSVFGARTGALAEYVTLRETRAARMPSNASFEQAAAMPIAGITALQGVRDNGAVRAGQKVLVNGASGGVGTYAVQIAKSLGAVVTGVCSARNVDMVRSIGADHVIDYTTTNFTRGTERYDVIIDNVGNHSLGDLSRVLAPAGTYVMIGGDPGKWLSPIPRVAATLLRSKFSDRQWRFFVASMNGEDLKALGDLMQSGRLTSVIDRRYRFEEVPEAVRYLETGRARGKVVIAVE
jgi:NADPH:quinone reductase-like Zn-dependent oxidoreductase